LTKYQLFLPLTQTLCLAGPSGKRVWVRGRLMQQNHKKPQESRIKKRGCFLYFIGIGNKSKYLRRIIPARGL